MKKRIVCLLLALTTLFTLSACGGGRYKTVKTICDRQYSIAFRNGDTTYHYIDAAIKELNYEGTIDILAGKWLGGKSTVSFASKKNAISELGYIEPRTFTIGVDLSSFPLCFESGSDYDGFDVELARAVCNKLGWQLRVHPILSKDAYIELNSGNIDCAWGGVVLDTESTNYTILATYMSDKLVIAAKGNGKSFLQGGSLYVGTDQMYLDVLEETPNISAKLEQITRVSGTPTEYFAHLDMGDCDFIIATQSGVRYYNG